MVKEDAKIFLSRLTKLAFTGVDDDEEKLDTLKPLFMFKNILSGFFYFIFQYPPLSLFKVKLSPSNSTFVILVE